MWLQARKNKGLTKEGLEYNGRRHRAPVGETYYVEWGNDTEIPDMRTVWLLNYG
jgi:hypothetical protein